MQQSRFVCATFNIVWNKTSKVQRSGYTRRSNSECWKMSKEHKKTSVAVEVDSLRRTYRLSKFQCVLIEYGQKGFQKRRRIAIRQLPWCDHIKRMGKELWPKRASEYKPQSRKERKTYNNIMEARSYTRNGSSRERWRLLRRLLVFFNYLLFVRLRFIWSLTVSYCVSLYWVCKTNSPRSHFTAQLLKKSSLTPKRHLQVALPHFPRVSIALYTSSIQDLRGLLLLLLPRGSTPFVSPPSFRTRLLHISILYVSLQYIFKAKCLLLPSLSSFGFFIVSLFVVVSLALRLQ